MRTMRSQCLLVLLPILALASLAHAQQATSHVGYASPAGGRQGTSFQVVLGGQNLEGATEVLASGGGIKASVLDYYKILSPGAYNLLKDQLKLLLDKKAASEGKGSAATQPAASRPAWTAADEAKVADLRKKLAQPPKRIDNPSLAETVTLEVTIDATAAPGQRELRLRTLTGITNPIIFCVSQLPEFSAKEIKAGAGKSATAIDLPAVINGQIMPGAIDQFKFQAKKGQHLVISTAARALIPYLSDAVPGWFQAALTLSDARGNELAFASHFRFDPDPLIYFQVPEDGEYSLAIRDNIYRGREDFVYRITIGELPHITGIFPLGCKSGAKATVELLGWNLPSNSITFDARDKAPGIYYLTVSNAGHASNPVPFSVDSLPEMDEVKPNGELASSQHVTLPVIINGRIAHPGDTAIYRFEGHVGQDLVAEITARRLDSPLDSFLKLTDSAGKQIAFNDDHEDKASALNTHYADSYIRVTLPATGAYFLHVADTQHKGGPEFAYRLRLGPPQPDFTLRVAPASISVRGGTSVPITVYALRKDGFTGEIALDLKNAPPGFSLSGAKIPANQDQLALTLKAPTVGAEDPFHIAFEGRATVQNQPVVHAAVPAEDMMQAFAYHHLVPVHDLMVAVSTKFGARNAVRILSSMPLKITPGSQVAIKASMPTETPLGKIELELNQPPDGITLKSVENNREGSQLNLQTDAAKLKPGLKGNLIVSAFLLRDPPQGTSVTAKRRIPIGSWPAIPFEVTGQ